MTFNSVLSERHKGRGQMTARGGAAKEKSLITNGMSCQALHDLQAIPGGGHACMDRLRVAAKGRTRSVGSMPCQAPHDLR